MKKYKALSRLCWLGVLVLSHLMCVVVAYNYASMLWCGRYGGCSAPADVAFLFAIPFVLGMVVLALLGWRLGRKEL